MGITEVRRANLRRWFENRTLPEREKSYLSQLMGGKASFGEKAARRLESTYGMPGGYLDAAGQAIVARTIERAYAGARVWVIGNGQGGLSGPAIKPIALLKVRQVYQVAKKHNIPIIGQGGIMTAQDALEFIIAGASAVGIGTALFYDPLVCPKINAGIVEYLQRHRLNHVSQLVGTLKARQDEPDCCG